MQADTLRLILLGLGVVLILGIYLWERRRSGKSGARSRQRAKEAPPEPTLAPEAGGQARSSGELSAEEEFADLPPLHVEHPDLRPAEKKEKTRKGPFGWGRRTEEPTPRTAPETPQTTEEHYRQSGGGVPHLILMINVAAKQSQDRFSGEAIGSAAAAVGLEQGAMNIFHRYEQPGVPRRVLFSMANMVEPGTFPFDALAGFSTPGLSLFAQLPGPRDGQLIYDTMLSAARKLAETLGGELQDETHSVLSRQTIEHTRTQIAEHHRQVALATKHT